MLVFRRRTEGPRLNERISLFLIAWRAGIMGPPDFFERELGTGRGTFSRLSRRCAAKEADECIFRWMLV